MPVKKRNIIYGLVDPISGQLRYVGKSEIGLYRVTQHMQPAFLVRDQRTHKANWVRYLLALGLRPDVEILQECRTREDLPEAEVFWISYFRYIGCNLTNLTSGGEGVPGRLVTLQTRRRLAMSRARVIEEKHDSTYLAGLRVQHRAKTKQSLVPERSAVWRARQSLGHGARRFIDQEGTMYDSVREAARVLGLRHQNIVAVLYGRAFHTKGFVFRFDGE